MTAVCAHDNARQIGCVLDADFFHDARTVDFHSARGDAEVTACYKIGAGQSGALSSFKMSDPDNPGMQSSRMIETGMNN